MGGARSTVPASNCFWITALHSSILFDFSSFRTRFASLRRFPSLLVSKGEWFPFSRKSCLVPSLVAFLQLFLELFVDNSLSSCMWICQPKNVYFTKFFVVYARRLSGKHVGGVDFFTRQSDTSTHLRVSSYRVPFSSRALRFGGGDSAAFAISQDDVYWQYLKCLPRDDSRNLCANTRIRLQATHSSFDILSDCFAILLLVWYLGSLWTKF